MPRGESTGQYRAESSTLNGLTFIRPLVSFTDRSGGRTGPRSTNQPALRSALHPVEFAAQRHEVWQIGSILPEAASLPQQRESIRARTAGEIPVDRLADELALAAPGTICQGRQLLPFTLGEIDLGPDHAYPILYMGNVWPCRSAGNDPAAKPRRSTSLLSAWPTSPVRSPARP